MRFKLHIDIGNSQMTSAGDIGLALSKLSERLWTLNETRFGSRRTIRESDSGTIFDPNGNSVGRWEVEGKHNDNDE